MRPTVLFLQTSPDFAADAQVHASIAAGLLAHGVGAVAACAPGSRRHPSAMITRFSALPGVAVIACRFGPRQLGRRPAELARAAAVDVPLAAIDIARLVVTARRRRVDVVHCTEKAREALTGYVLARLVGARLTVHLHVGVAPWFRRPTTWVMHRADRLVAISDSVRQSALDAGYPPEQISVALNALAPQTDPTLLSPDDRHAVREEFGSADDARLVAIVARLNPWKGHSELFSAVAAIIEDVPDLLVLVVGEGAMRPEFEALAAELGIADRVQFTGFRHDALRLIHASDVFAMPSQQEPFGLVYLEAMRCGVPVVALHNGGTPEVVENGVTGLLSAAGDIEALATNLRRLLLDAQLRARMGAAGRDRVEQRFQPDRLAGDFAAIVRSVVGS